MVCTDFYHCCSAPSASGFAGTVQKPPSLEQDSMDGPSLILMYFSL
jgi:hypothetical protein